MIIYVGVEFSMAGIEAQTLEEVKERISKALVKEFEGADLFLEIVESETDEPKF